MVDHDRQDKERAVAIESPAAGSGESGRQRAAIEIMVVQAVAWWYVEDPLSDRELEVCSTPQPRPSNAPAPSKF